MLPTPHTMYRLAQLQAADVRAELLRDQLAATTQYGCEIAKQLGVIRHPVERCDADNCVHGLIYRERPREVCVDDLDPFAPVGHAPLQLIEHRPGSV